MPHFLSGTESALAGGLFHGRFRQSKFLSAAGEKLRNVLDRVVGARGSRRLRWTTAARISGMPGNALIFILVGIVRTLGIVSCRASPGRTAEGGRPHMSLSTA